MKNVKHFKIALAIILLISFLAACKKDDSSPSTEFDPNYQPVILPSNFVDSITNPYLNFIPGKTFISQGQTENGFEVDSFKVTHQTKTILGVKCLVVNDIAYLDGKLEEQTYDWFAQDLDGNIWYMGEAATQISNGQVSGTEGSWEAGVNGAQPGIVMQAHPQLGVPYRQEYLHTVAEDWGKVISTSDTTTVPYGFYSNCYVTEEWSPLDEGVVEHKFYAAGVGLVRSMFVQGGSEDIKLVGVQ